jgi:nucleotide-binding universal stress UspA family protein
MTNVFSKILIPTDGSPAAAATVQAGIKFAHALHAQVLGLFVAPVFHYPIYVESVPPTYLSEQDYRQSLQTVGETYLLEMKNAAEKSGVQFSRRIVFSNTTALSIVQAAKDDACDLIFIGSHGRTGWQALMLGSVTLKVLSISPIPVLVYTLPQVLPADGKPGLAMNGT